MQIRKRILGYENYSIDTKGDFLNERTGKKLKLAYTGNGYGYVAISNKKGKKRAFAHREVAKAFLNYFEGCEVHHKDGNSKNNNVENLECLTKYEHRKVSYEKGQTFMFDKEIDQYTLNGEFVASHKSIMAASRALNLDFRNISAVVNGKNQKSCGGFLFTLKGKNPPNYIRNKGGRRSYKVAKFKKSGELIDVFETLHEAHIKSGITKSVINSSVLNRSVPRGEYYWKKVE